jgi:hypothetical protein
MSPAPSPPSDPPRADTLMQLVFHGECLAGHDRRAVRLAVAAALRLDEQRTARLFSGRRVVLRREVSAAAAERHVERFARMGAVLHAEASQARRPRRAQHEAAPAGRVSARWLRRLRWAGIGVVASIVLLMLGVALWPLLSALAPASRLASDSAAPWATTSLPAARAPAALASAPEAEDIPPDMSPDALREYKQGYVHARGHKAFALSSNGAHAWNAGATSPNEASEGALAACMTARRAVDDGCRIVDLDGEWQE